MCLEPIFMRVLLCMQLWTMILMLYSVMIGFFSYFDDVLKPKIGRAFLYTEYSKLLQYDIYAEYTKKDTVESKFSIENFFDMNMI